MRRDLERLRTESFDLLVIGGGVQGAALAQVASARGLKVALIERDDFASGTSSNSLKILHGGLRYLQQLDIVRMRRSTIARREWMRLAPGLVRPLPCAISSRGFGARSPAAFAGALAINDLIAYDRNAGLPESIRVPNGRMLSREEFGRICRPLSADRGTFGAMWWDVLALDTEALVMQLVARATSQSAAVANYVEAVQLLAAGGRAHGVAALDRETGVTFEVRAACTVWAGGRGGHEFAAPCMSSPLPAWQWCAGLNVVLKSNAEYAAALALSMPAHAARGPMSTGPRELFFVPWRRRLMAGTHYVPLGPGMEDASLRRPAMTELLEMIERAAPYVHPSERQIEMMHWGHLPLDPRWRTGEPLKLASDMLVTECGVGGLRDFWIIAPPKFTTAVQTAQRLLERIYPRFSQIPLGRSEPHPLSYPDYKNGDPRELGDDECETAGYTAANEGLGLHLADAVFRRTGLGSAGFPGRRKLESCARGMARGLGWSQERTAVELSAVMQQYRDRHFLTERPTREAHEETK